MSDRLTIRPIQKRYIDQGPETNPRYDYGYEAYWGGEEWIMTTWEQPPPTMPVKFLRWLVQLEDSDTIGSGLIEAIREALLGTDCTRPMGFYCTGAWTVDAESFLLELKDQPMADWARSIYDDLEAR